MSTKLDRGPEAVFDRIARCVHYAIDECDLRMNQMQGMAVGAGGWIDESQGLVRKSSELGWEDVPLGPGLAEHISIPLHVANSYHLAALGTWVHDIRSVSASVSSALALFLGPEIGGAFIRDGMWTPSGDAETADIMERPQENVLRTFPSTEFRGLRNRDFRKALRQGSQAAQTFLDEMASAAGVLVGRLAGQIRPQAIVIGGGTIEDVRETVLGKVRAKAAETAPHSSSLVWIASTLSDSATITGAATWAASSRQALLTAS